ncbi:DUF3471 domain-containing protein [Methylobacterium sp. Leaf125]|uniref:DUF3471 domain-containing protein n=1 Tax=Methylobacterium sp. Leaf125 TaxID=1736265 RepID=UPI000A46E81B|nr:DUF3471 domain-containing protein [Methylobacterium sp. Leaf125]
MTATLLSGAAPVRALPVRPNLEHLRNEAKSRLKQERATDPTAQLATAQRDLARDYGFPSWRRLLAEVRKLTEGLTETGKERMERLRIEQARPRTEVPIDPTVVDGYLGFYELTPTIILVVQRDQNDLIVRLTGQAFCAIVPESRRKFFYRNSTIQAQISFTVGPDGIATAATLHQNGLEQTSPRITGDRANAIEARREARQAANTPAPGSEAALRRIIEATQQGRPELARMSKPLARAFDEQLPDNLRTVRSWGDLVSVDFKGVSRIDDSDVFTVVFSAAESEWRLTMNGPETIESASFRLTP